MNPVQAIAVVLVAVALLSLVAVGFGTYLRAHEPPERDKED